MSQLRTEKLLALLLFFLTIAWLLVLGLQAITGVDWPISYDPYRDIATAKTFLNESGGSDYAYKGERIWYNPLVPALMAFLADNLGMPMHELYAKGGAVLSLAAPISFFAFCWIAFDHRVALCASLALLFLTSTMIANYSFQLHNYTPYLPTSSLSHSLLYIGWAIILLSGKFLCSKTLVTRFIAALILGTWLGISFLAHTSIALQLGMLTACVVLFPRIFYCSECRPSAPSIGNWGALIVILVSAFLVAMPLVRPILFHYGLDVLNPQPAAWVGPPVQLINVWKLVQSFLNPYDLFALIGLASVIFGLNSTHSQKRPFVLLWLGIPLVWIALSYLVEAVNHRGMLERIITLPVPSIHFLIALKAMESLLFGLGLVYVADRVASKLTATFPAIQHLDTSRISFTLLSAACLISVSISYTSVRDHLASYQSMVRYRKLETPVTEFLEAFTTRHTVVLAQPEDALHLVVPSGAKTVVVPAFFSNPYVDFETRREDMLGMYSSLENEDLPKFHLLACQYDVELILFQQQANQPIMLGDSFRRVFSNQRYSIFEYLDVCGP